MYYFVIFITMVNIQQITCNSVPFFLDYSTTDSTINPCDNFYAFSCSNWRKHTKKPESEPIWNHWMSAASTVTARLANLVAKNTPDLNDARVFHRACLTNRSYDHELTRLVEVFTNHSHWLNSVYSATNTLGIHPIVKLRVEIDYNDPERHILYVEPGNLIFPQYILSKPGKYRKELQSYVKWVNDTLTHLYKKTTINPDDVVNCEVKLASLPRNDQVERLEYQELLKKFPQFGVIPLSKHLKPDSQIVLKDPLYFKLLFRLSTRINPEAYVQWSIIHEFDRDVSEHVRHLNFHVNRAVFDVNKDVSRATECVHKTSEYFSDILAPAYVKKYMKREMIDDIKAMVEKIKSELVRKIDQSQWLSREARNMIGAKLKRTKAHLGWIPKPIVKVKITDNHFKNLLRLKNRKATVNFDRLTAKVTYLEFEFNPFDVNAYYSILENAIFLPLGLWEPPFYDIQRPLAINYATLGSLIGHELSHAIDSRGIEANAVGRIGSWLPTSDLVTFKNRCKGHSEISSEVMADQVGVDVAYKAVIGRNHRKTFFTSWAQMWCEIGSTDFVDEHGEVERRVNQLFYSSRDFRKAFKCTNFSENSEWELKHCKVW